MATFDRPLFARRAIELFHRQTWKNKELVVLHDGPMTEALSMPGPNVRWVHFNGYEGMTRKHRWGMAIASGEILATWDDDDFFGPKRLEAQVAPLVTGAADAVGFPVHEILDVPSGTFWKWKTAIAVAPKKAAPTPSYSPVIPFHDGTAMYKRRLLDGIPDKIREASQLALLTEFARKGARLLQIPNDRHFVYVRHGSNGWKFKTEDRCIPVDRPHWFTDEDLAFYKNPELVKR